MMDAATLTNCPQCGGSIVYSGDGRARLCERCDWRQPVERERISARELVAALQFVSRVHKNAKATLSWSSVERAAAERAAAEKRRHFRVGVGAAREGRVEEAFHYLEQVLYSDRADDDLLAETWYWLGVTYSDADDKRICLLEALRLKPRHPAALREMALLDGRLTAAELIDPEAAADDVVDPITAVYSKFSCPRCDARLIFDPAAGGLRCEFCGYGADGAGLTSTDSVEQDFILALATARGHRTPLSMRIFQCHNCAVEFLLAPTTLSLTCPYCDGVYVTAAAESVEVVPPQALIPFNIDEDAARDAINGWFGQQGITYPSLSPVVGWYLPAWTFDIVGGGFGKGKETFFDDVLVPAERRLSPSLATAVHTFNLRSLVPYEERYLAAWPAERYQISVADASLQARGQVVRRQQGVTGMPLTVLSFKGILLPFWLAHYQIAGRTYDILVNGQNGVVEGERPST